LEEELPLTLKHGELALVLPEQAWDRLDRMEQAVASSVLVIQC
jgi:hypothetical protein